ncbi:enoyl-CoA hydratase/isomerase family protein [Blastococcus sp. SYSU DS0973]
MAGTGEVQLEVDDGVAIVTLNAPDRRNALTPGMADELIATFDEVDAKPEVGALVIRGVGKSFCAGGDVATLTSAGKDPAAADPTRAWGRSTTPSTGSAR